MARGLYGLPDAWQGWNASDLVWWGHWLESLSSLGPVFAGLKRTKQFWDPFLHKLVLKLPQNLKRDHFECWGRVWPDWRCHSLSLFFFQAIWNVAKENELLSVSSTVTWQRPCTASEEPDFDSVELFLVSLLLPSPPLSGVRISGVHRKL